MGQKTRTPWQVTREYELAPSDLLESLKRGIYTRIIGSAPQGEKLEKIADATLVRLVDEYRLRCKDMDKSNADYPLVLQIAAIVQAAAEKRGYTFRCACGKPGLIRPSKKVYCSTKCMQYQAATSRTRAAS